MRILKIVYHAFIDTKNFYRSLFGYDIKKNITNNTYSEFNIKYWTFIEFIKLISDLFFIKLPICPPLWIPEKYRGILFGSYSKYIKNDIELDSSGNCFIYINGIMSNEKLVMINKKYLETLLNKPINIIHNITQTLVMDLIECLIGKETEYLTEASTISLYTITSKLLDDNINKIIIICHSQGTIIVAKVLNTIKKMGLDKDIYLSKLEIYAFANCATNMSYIKNNLPYMEHFANDNDFVAKCGCNCPQSIKKYINIDGEIFINKHKSGHMLNSHYLNNFKVDYPTSKLNMYF